MGGKLYGCWLVQVNFEIDANPDLSREGQVGSGEAKYSKRLIVLSVITKALARIDETAATFSDGRVKVRMNSEVRNP